MFLKKVFNRIRYILCRPESIRQSYKNDCSEYMRWQYNNPKVKTKNAFEAKILRQAHVLEKGMSLSNPRERFGVQKAEELLNFIDEFEKTGFKIEESSSILNAINVLGAYLEFHKDRGFVPELIDDKFEKYRAYCDENLGAFGVIKLNKEDIIHDSRKSFPEFLKSRHSIRQFANTPIDINDVKKAVQLAMYAPSACNRQSCKAYFYADEKTNKALGKMIAGNTGFENEVQNYLVITSDMSAFYDAFERNQIYVDGGIFTMSLIESLHYYGIASCVLQNGEFKQRNSQFKSICGNIPENEKIILFIAIGYYKDEFTYATSHRKDLNEVLIIKK